MEVRSAALFLNAQAQFRSQLTTDQGAHPQQFFFVAQVAEMRIAEQVADPPTSGNESYILLYDCKSF